jgi:hypothetical protein
MKNARLVNEAVRIPELKGAIEDNRHRRDLSKLQMVKIEAL